VEPIDLISLFDRPPAISSRSDWGALAVKEPFKTHTIQKITIHHAGVSTNKSRTYFERLRALQSWSQRADELSGGKPKPAWPDIPYHFYVSWQGEIAEARPWNVVGDTNTEYDPTGHLLICVEGNFENEEPNGMQLRALSSLVVWLADKYHVDGKLIESHKDFSKQTTCPGANLYPELERIRWRVDFLRKMAGRTL